MMSQGHSLRCNEFNTCCGQQHTVFNFVLTLIMFTLEAKQHLQRAVSPLNGGVFIGKSVEKLT